MSDPSSSLRAELEPFRVEVSRGRDAVRVAPVGELDMATAGALDANLRELLDNGIRRFLLDLHRLTFMDSSGLWLILNWDSRARRDGISLTLIQGPPAVQRLFEIAGVADRLPFQAR